MNWKVLAGIVLVGVLMTTAFLVMHTEKINPVSTVALDGGNGGNQTDDGPHPPISPDSWEIAGALEGPHPPISPDSW